MRDWTSARVHELRTWTALSGEDRWLLIKTTFLVFGIRLGLELFSLRTIQKYFSPSLPSAPADSGVSEQYQNRVAWAVHGVGCRLLGDRPCLPQALAAQWLLGRRGIRTTFHIGAAKDEDGRLLAHAWLEHEGRIIVGGRTSRSHYVKFKPFLEQNDT